MDPVRSSFAAVRIGLPPFAGSAGSGFAIDDVTVLTNRHVLTVAGVPVDKVELSRPGGGTVTGTVLARSVSLDLGIVCVPRGFLAPAPLALQRPVVGAHVWALGTSTFGSPVAMGRIVAPRATLAGVGEGVVARVAALAGFSGGPLVDEDGRVVAVTSAVWSPNAATMLSSLVGVDLEGLLDGERREVFAIGIDRALDEAMALRQAARAAGRFC